MNQIVLLPRKDATVSTRRVIRGMLIRDFLDPREQSLRVPEGIYAYEAEDEKHLDDIYDEQWTYRIRREPAVSNDGQPGLVEVFTKAIDLSDVFSTSDANAATYVDRDFAESTYGVVLALALNDPGKVVLLHGPSKVGKTALWRSTIVDPIEVHCNRDTTLVQLYEDILGQLQSTSLTSITTETIDERERGVAFTGTAGKDGVAQIGVTASASNTQSNSTSKETSVSQPAINARTVAAQLRSAQKALLFENYHRMSSATFDNFAVDLRVFMDHHVTTVFVGIPDDPYRIIAANNELEGRVSFLDFEFWDPQDLKRIALNGAEVLNIEFDSDTLDFLACEAAGSPLLMQEYCWLACVANQIGRDQDSTVDVSLTFDQFKRAFKTIESTKFPHFGRIHSRLEEICGGINGIPSPFVSKILELIRDKSVLSIPLDNVNGLNVSNEDCSQIIAALNADDLTADLFAMDPDARRLSICRPLYLPYIRWLTQGNRTIA